MWERYRTSLTMLDSVKLFLSTLLSFHLKSFFLSFSLVFILPGIDDQGSQTVVVAKPARTTLQRH